MTRLFPYRWRCRGGSIRRPARLRCWSAGSCDPASWPPRPWPPRRSSEPAAAPWQCSTSSGPLGPAGGCTKRAAPPLLTHDRKQKKQKNRQFKLCQGCDNTNVSSVEVSSFTAWFLNCCCSLATVQSVVWLRLLEHFASLQLPGVVRNGSVNGWLRDSRVLV